MPEEPPKDLPITVDDIDSAPDDVAATSTDTQVGVETLTERLARVGQDRDEFAAELERTKSKVRTIEILDSLITPYAHRAFWFMCSYCGAVALMLLLHGWKICSFSLPDGVLQFLVGSTATTVIGLVGMVLTGIFVGARRNHD